VSEGFVALGTPECPEYMSTMSFVSTTSRIAGKSPIAPITNELSLNTNMFLAFGYLSFVLVGFFDSPHRQMRTFPTAILNPNFCPSVFPNIFFIAVLTNKFSPNKPVSPPAGTRTTTKFIMVFYLSLRESFSTLFACFHLSSPLRSDRISRNYYNPLGVLLLHIIRGDNFIFRKQILNLNPPAIARENPMVFCANQLHSIV
jgi:hypothetical protein